MKIDTQVYIMPGNVAHVHLRSEGTTRLYKIPVSEAMAIYPDKTIHMAVAKVAKDRFRGENAFCGYE